MLGKKADVSISATTSRRRSTTCAPASRPASRRKRSPRAPALKGFDDVAQVNPRISLAGVLESAYDELAKK